MLLPVQPRDRQMFAVKWVDVLDAVSAHAKRSERLIGVNLSAYLSVCPSCK